MIEIPVHHTILTTLGEVIFVIGQAVVLPSTVRATRAYRDNIEDESLLQAPHRSTERITDCLNGAIFLGGLIAMTRGSQSGTFI